MNTAFADGVFDRLAQCGRGIIVVMMGIVLGASGRASAQDRPVSKGATVELVADGFQATTGPVWYHGRLLFSDVPDSTLYRWTPENGTDVFMRLSGEAPTGLAVDITGHLLLAQSNGQLARRSGDGTTTPIVRTYGGKRLNGPTDVTIASSGTIYFTDAPHGTEAKGRHLGFSGVYRLSTTNTLTLLTKSLSRPAGISLAPNDSTLYVNDSESGIVWAYSISDQGEVVRRGQFAAPRDANADGTTNGLTVDANGNVYTTGPGGVWVYGPNGKKRTRIAVPKSATNLTFGGPDHKTLYITARPHVYRVSVNVPGRGK